MSATMKAGDPPTRTGPWFKIDMLATSAAEIWLFGDIGYEVTAQGFVEQLNALGPLQSLAVHVNSLGGVVHESLVIYNQLKASPATVTMYVEGVAASSMSLIVMAGDEIIMRDGALMMIHDPSAGARGTVEEIKRQADVLDKLRGEVAAIYAARSGQDEQAVREIMRVETWYTGAEAVAAGFADRVDGAVEPETMRATAMDAVMHLPNVPPALAAALRAVPAPKQKDDDMKVGSNPPAAPAATPQPAPSQTADPSQMAAPVPTPQAPAPAPGQADPAMMAVADERKRTNTILSAARMAGVGQDFAMQLVRDGVAVDAAVMQIQTKWAEADQTPEPRAHVRMVADSRDKFVEGAVQALLMRAGLEKANMAGNEFVGMNLRELARHSLDVAGMQARGKPVLEMVGMAFAPHMAGGHSTSDFGNILANIASKAMLKGFEEAEETFQGWTSTGTLTDFKPTSRVDLNLFPALAEVAEGAEYKHATIGDRGETTQLATYGRMFAITRQAIVNDDMDAFTRIPLRMGRAAIRTVGNLVYAVLTANQVMSDGKALFHADHANLAGAGAAPSTATLDALRVAMATQKDPDGHATGGLNIRPAYILVPAALEGTAKQALESEYDTAKGDKGVPNSVRGMAEVISDARLDTASSTAWYGAANPGIHDTVEVSYLDGQKAPYLEQRDGWNIDGTEFKVRIDAGVKALGYRAMYKNPGA